MNAVRIVISDFLVPHDPERLVRRLAGDGTVLWMIQTLAACFGRHAMLAKRAAYQIFDLM